MIRRLLIAAVVALVVVLVIFLLMWAWLRPIYDRFMAERPDGIFLVQPIETDRSACHRTITGDHV